MKKLFAAILFAFSVASAPAFGACSFLCNDGSGNGTFGHNLTVEGTLTVNGGGSTTFTNLTVTGDLTVQGNTTLGNASGDTLTINAGTWTYGSNWTATRAAGALAAGAVNVQTWTTTATGDAGGTTQGRGLLISTAGSGANSFTELRAILPRVDWGGSVSTTQIVALGAESRLTSSGNVVTANGVISNIQVLSTGSVTGTANAFNAGIPALSSTGTIATYNAYRVGNLGNALVTTAVGLKVDDFTNSTTMRGIQSSLSSGSGKHNLYIDGTATNYLEGTTGIGVSAPNASAKLHVRYSGTGTISDPIANAGVVFERDNDMALNFITPNTATAYINFGDPEDSNTGRIFYNHPSNYLAFGINGSTERFRMDSTGNLISTGTTFGSLGTPSNGSLIYCSDCTIANPCAGGGTGAFAKRLNGAWVCN